jgi:hypothetical protein
MKGLNQIVSFTILIAVAVSVALIVQSWLMPFSNEQTSTLENQTKEKLACQYASVYIRNVTYNCSSDCSAAATRNITVEIENSGTLTVGIDNIYIRNTTGTLFSLSLNETKMLVTGDVVRLENISTMSCSGINNSIDVVRVITNNCPGTAYDSFPGADVIFLDC